MEKPYDVAVVGYGPVGQALTGLLARRGLRVVAVERWPALFPLPRAGHVDHEIMRIFQSLGVAEQIAEDSWELSGYELRAGSGEVLHSFDWGYPAQSGWYSDYSLFQPYLESLLHGVVTQAPTATLLRGWQVERLVNGEDLVELEIRRGHDQEGTWHPDDETRTVQARYVVGCDGANSIVRETLGIEFTDFGFEADWLVVFAEPNDPALRVDMPDVAQILDPARPTTVFRSSGKRFCRWEFMLMPGETPEQMSTPEVAWELIARWGLTPENSRLVRNTVFRFRSLVATEWRVGRCLIAGDAAHLMPPFLGQGMCSGLRDAKNLDWKLDLVLRGVAGDALLDTYALERRPHVESIVQASLGVGELISVTDVDLAAARDERLRTGTVAPPEPMPALVDGVLRRAEDGSVMPPAGELSRQGEVEFDGRSGRFDDVVGGGWVVLTTGWEAGERLSEEAFTVLDVLAARVVRIEATALPGVARDRDGMYLEWMKELGAQALILRPDFYVFAAASDGSDLESAIAELGEQLGLHRRSAIASSPGD